MTAIDRAHSNSDLPPLAALDGKDLVERHLVSHTPSTEKATVKSSTGGLAVSPAFADLALPKRFMATATSGAGGARA